jgi:hypothetical protein
MKALAATALLGVSLCMVGLGTAAAQAPSNAPNASPRKAASGGRGECVLSVGLCVTVPADWQRIGDVFDGLGFVVAEPHPGTDTAVWITVSAIEPLRKDGNPVSLDSLVEIVLTPGGSFTSAETLQRTRLVLNGRNAEIVRVRLHEETNNTESTEAAALIEGSDGLVYLIALRCAPQDFSRLEAVFQKVIHSWRLQPPEAQSATHSATQPAIQPQPKQDSDKK